MKKKKFSVFFVGTSSGKTSLKRFHSSLLLKSPDFNLLIDCGEGTSKALLANKISHDTVDGILFSHLHPDHSAGFASFIVQIKQQKRKKPLKIFCHRNLVEVLKSFLSNSFVFTQKAAFSLEYFQFEHDEKITVSKHIKLTSKQNTHLDKYLKYLSSESGFASSSFLFEMGGEKIFYSGDISTYEDLFLFKEEKPKIIISEAAHITWEQILDYYHLIKPEVIFLTHYSDELEKKLKKKIFALPQILHRKIILAEDGKYFQW